MTEIEYVILKNRINVEHARDAMSEVTGGKKYGVNYEKVIEARRLLAEIQCYLASVELTTND